MSISINQIVNGNVYINGNSQMGRANEVKIPDVEFEKVSHKGLGLHGEIKLPAVLTLSKLKLPGIAFIRKFVCCC